MWYFYCDAIEKGPELLEQKDNALPSVQPTMCSTLSVYDIPRLPPTLQQLVMCSKLLVTSASFMSYTFR